MTPDADFRTPVTVVTGFLGSGKTTLLNRLLTGVHGVRFGVLVNDFGEVNIDARLVTAVDGQAIDLSNGCVCCTMQGGLVTNIRKLLSRPNPPQHLIVEASGIADPLGIVSAFRTNTLRDLVRLDAVIAVVDSENARDPRLDRQVVEDQIRAADLVLLNKLDLVDPASRGALIEWLRGIVPGAQLVETVRGDAPLERLIGPRHHRLDRGSTGAPRHEASDDACIPSSHRIQSWTFQTRQPLAYRKTREALEGLPDSIFRAKGILYLADAPSLQFVAHRVGRRTEIDVLGPWGDEPRATDLVVLGEPGSTDGKFLTRCFDSCATEAVPLLPPQNFRRLTEELRRSAPDRATLREAAVVGRKSGSAAR